jgi:2-polyprenyl-6-methoxyphenol hydroxylase-like FAD-dependent oxidoreductase
MSSASPEEETKSAVAVTTSPQQLQQQQDLLKPHTLVVGGGLAGIAAAVALHKIAELEHVHIIEARGDDSIANDRAGAAMQLGPNAFKALEAIGGQELLDQIYQQGSILKNNFMIVPGGAPPLQFPHTAQEETGYPMVLIRWGVLRRLLGDLLPDQAQRLVFGVGNDIAGYRTEQGEKEEKHSPSKEEEEKEDDPMLRTVIPVTTRGEPVSLGTTSFAPHLIVGADGLHSVFRQCINHNCDNTVKAASLDTLKDNRRVNIKAAVPVELATLGVDFSTNPQSTFVQMDSQLACFAGPAGPGFSYWAISIGDDANGVPFFSNDDPKNDMIAAKSRLLDKLGEESSSSSSALNRDWIIRLVEQTDPFTILINRSVEAPVEGHNSFVSNDGKVVLLGDAAHAMNPSYGQSASFAFEDAATLATAIREGRSKGDTLPQALQVYSDKRVGRCMEMQRRSEERAAKAMRGEAAEDVSKWIHAWEL